MNSVLKNSRSYPGKGEGVEGQFGRGDMMNKGIGVRKKAAHRNCKLFAVVKV